jgi:hypothetical protein
LNISPSINTDANAMFLFNKRKIKLTRYKKARTLLSIFVFLITLAIFITKHCSSTPAGPVEETKHKTIPTQVSHALILSTITIDGTPLPQIDLEIQAIPQPGKISIGVPHKTDKKGNLTISSLPPGRYTVTTKSNHVLKTTKITQIPQKSPLILKIQLLEKKAGIAIDGVGTPVSQAAITCELKKTGKVVSTISNSDGSFSIYILAGDFCTLNGSKKGYMPPSPIVISPSLRKVKLIFQPVSTVTLEVLDENEKPIPYATVAIGGPGIWPPLLDRTGSNGRLNLHKLNSGIFSISAWSEDLVADLEGIEIEPGKKTVIHIHLKKGVFLRGLVRESTTDSPISGALFTIGLDQPSLIVKQIITDDKGKFRIGPFTPALYKFSLAAPGYVSFSGRRYWISKKGGLALFELSKGVTITGRVLDDLGNGIKDAQVEIWGITWSGGLISPLALNSPELKPSGELGILSKKTVLGLQANGAVLTDKKGDFKLKGIPPGWLALRIIHENYMPKYSPLGQIEKSPAYKEFILKLGGDIHGEVVDDLGTPLYGVEIRAESPIEPAFSYTLFTDKDGKYKISGAPSIITLTYRHPDYPVKTETIKLVKTHRTILPIGKRVITLNIRDAHGFNIKNSSVQLNSIYGQNYHHSKTDSKGTVRFEKLGTSEFYATISHENYPAFTTKKLKDGTNDIVIPYGGGISLFIRDEDTKKPLNPFIMMVHESGKVIIPKSQVGELKLINILSGKWNIYLNSNHYAHLKATLSVERGNKPDVLPAGEKTIEMTRAGVIKGLVRDQKGFPVRNSYVLWKSKVTKTDGRGKFRLRDIPPGNIQITAWHAKYGLGKENLVVEKDLETTNIIIDLKNNTITKILQSGITIEKENSTGAVLIKSIEKDSPAWKSNLVIGDEIISINGLFTGIPMPFLKKQLEGKSGEYILIITGKKGRTLKTTIIHLN